MVYHVTIVSHTHWDREWYQPFQVFRFQLVELVDYLLALLDSDPAYQSFLLDGQTIILEDYLAIRPEREADLKRHVESGRLVVGPWHILPDEFLVSPEASVRNLMLGAKVAGRFGGRMSVGYTPDPFGHISQLPQILAGVGLEAVALQRGLADESTELWWEAPDGTRLLTIFFRAGYGNLAWAPTAPEAFTRAVENQLDRLIPYAHTPYLLMLNGTDHMLPQPELPNLIASANERLAGRAVLEHGTLPKYVHAVRGHLGDDADLPVIRGELRSSKRSPVLPGVYSARMWIKQSNHACEVALERYAEPVSALVHIAGGEPRHGELEQAWRYLIENHPHDSICGCSVDQVHEEMRSRFAWSQQMADMITEAGLRALGGQVDATQLPALPVTPVDDPPTHAVLSDQSDLTVLVYNPLPGTQTDEAQVTVPWAGPRCHYQLLDREGHPIPYRVDEGNEIIFEACTVSADELPALLDQIEIGFYKGRLISSVSFWIDGEEARIEMVLPEYHTGQIGDFSGLVRRLRDDAQLNAVRQFHLTTYLAANYRLSFMAQDVAGVGYQTYRLSNSAGTDSPALPSAPAALTDTQIENDWIQVHADPQDGTLTITDKATGVTYQSLNQLEDGGDRGDEYNYCTPDDDTVVTTPVRAPHIECHDEGPFGQVMVIKTQYAVPENLTKVRRSRSGELVDLPVTTTVRIKPQSRRVEIHTELTNNAQNHRIRVLFPAGLTSDHAIVDGHFDRLERGFDPEVDTTGWAEQPTPTRAQRTFTALSDGSRGLMVAARGLPEYEHISGENTDTLALTLLRSVGWLSRDDLVCRPGHAGPERATPGAQCLGPASYDYSIIPFGADDFTLDDAAQEAYAFDAPLRGVAVNADEGTLPPALQLVRLEPAALVMSALKPAETGEGVILRFYNSSSHAIDGKVHFGLPVQCVEPVNLLEETSGDAFALDDAQSLALTVPAKRIVTLRVVL